MHHFLEQLANPIGILGVVLILIAYYLLSVGKWAADSLIYQFLNFLGAWFILYSLYFYWNLSSFIIEVAWIGISVVGMCRTVKTDKSVS